MTEDKTMFMAKLYEMTRRVETLEWIPGLDPAKQILQEEENTMSSSIPDFHTLEDSTFLTDEMLQRLWQQFFTYVKAAIYCCFIKNGLCTTMPASHTWPDFEENAVDVFKKFSRLLLDPDGANFDDTLERLKFLRSKYCFLRMNKEEVDSVLSAVESVCNQGSYDTTPHPLDSQYWFRFFMFMHHGEVLFENDASPQSTVRKCPAEKLYKVLLEHCTYRLCGRNGPDVDIEFNRLCTQEPKTKKAAKMPQNEARLCTHPWALRQSILREMPLCSQDKTDMDIPGALHIWKTREAIRECVRAQSKGIQ